MKKYSALIVDDEVHAIDGLYELLKMYCPEVNVVATASSTASAIPEFVKHKPDIAFLDIEMYGGSGLDLADIAKTIGTSLVFVTGHAGYAQQAFTVDAVHYLLKPVSYNDLRVAIARIAVRRNREVALTSEFRVRVSSTSGLQFIFANDIVAIEGDGRYSTIHLINDGREVVTRNIGEFELELNDHGFFRVHKSWLVNCAHVVKLSNTDGGTVELRNGITVLLARRRKSDFLKRMER